MFKPHTEKLHSCDAWQGGTGGCFGNMTIMKLVQTLVVSEFGHITVKWLFFLNLKLVGQIMMSFKHTTYMRSVRIAEPYMA